MARIRSIKPEFWVSEQIAECSPNARLTFIGLWNFSDDNGVHPAKPKTLKAELYPMDDFSAADIAEWVAELVRVGLLVEFESEGLAYWHITGWTKHQKIDRPSCKYPVPPERNSESDPPPLGEDSTNARRAPPPGVDRSGVDRSGVEKATSPKARPAAGPIDAGERGTRLPADWVMTAEDRQYCAERRPELDPDAVAENFREYWLGKPGKDGRRINWSTTWRGWVRKERADPSNSRKAPSHSDAKPAWALAAGFPNRFDAENAGCFERNAASFRNGTRMEPA